MLTYLHIVTVIISIILTQAMQDKPNHTGSIALKNKQRHHIPSRKDYTYIEAGKSFYKSYPTKHNWHDAKKLCAEEGASLFFAENKTENDAVIAFWKQNPKTYEHYRVYVGLSDIVTEGVFLTIDGRLISEVYYLWHREQPDNFQGNEDCVHMDQAGYMNDINCDTLSYFICKWRPKSLEEITSTSCNNQWRNSTITLKTLVFWPKANVPFYINPNHFGEDQIKVILESLAMFEFETCIKFEPLMVAPVEGQHVMTFINPKGVRRCTIETNGHANYSPHLIQLGYNCMESRELDMIIMRALGLPFEHNRACRDLYIDVWIENIEPSYIQLFTKDCNLPIELRKIPYDLFSIMHFGERDYSKTGHRTIRIKNEIVVQAREGISPTDIKKIGLTASDKKKLALIYGAECRTRDRAEQIAKCRYYAGGTRRKRENRQSMTGLSGPGAAN